MYIYILICNWEIATNDAISLFIRRAAKHLQLLWQISHLLRCVWLGHWHKGLQQLQQGPVNNLNLTMPQNCFTHVWKYRYTPTWLWKTMEPIMIYRNFMRFCYLLYLCHYQTHPRLTFRGRNRGRPTAPASPATAPPGAASRRLRCRLLPVLRSGAKLSALGCSAHPVPKPKKSVQWGSIRFKYGWISRFRWL